MKNFNIENACHTIASAAAEKVFADFVPYQHDGVKHASEAARVYAKIYKHAMIKFQEIPDDD